MEKMKKICYLREKNRLILEMYRKGKRMYTLLLVDDEKLELETLRDYIDWKSMGITAVYTAGSGKEAYKKVWNLQPDIMITDIHMPVISGIELVQQLHEEHSNVQVIFLTGYDDVENIKGAFRLEAVDYILKPFSFSAIRIAVEKAIQQLKKKQLLDQSADTLKKQYFKIILKSDNSYEIEEAFRQLREIDGNPLEDSFVGIIQARGYIEQEKYQQIEKNFSEVLFSLEEEGKITFLVLPFVDFRDSAKRLQGILEATGDKVGMLYYKTCISVKEIREIYAQFEMESRTFFYANSDIWMVTERKEDRRIVNEKEEFKEYQKNVSELKNLIRLMERGDFLKVQDYFCEYFQKASREQRNYQYVREEILGFFQNVYGMFIAEKGIQELISEKKIFRKKIQTISSINELEKAVRQKLEYLQMLEGRTQERMEKGKKEYVCTYVKKYIMDHYQTVVSVETIAEELGLSVNYVRNIFKDYAGITLNEYLTEYRLKQALELLRNPKLRVREVGKMVGYENSSYFGTVFAKKYNMTPNEYKNAQLGIHREEEKKDEKKG